MIVVAKDGLQEVVVAEDEGLVALWVGAGAID
jgi:hypothetical protein